MLMGLLFNWYVTIGSTLICFGLAAFANRLKSLLQVWFRTILVLCIIILVLQTLFIPGDTPIVSWWVFEATEESFVRGVNFASRVMGVGTAILLLIEITDLSRLVISLEQRGINPRITYVITATVNIIPQMRNRMGTIMDAQRARGIETDANLFVRAKAFIPTMGPLILNSVVGVEEKAITLEARGFTAQGERTSIHYIDDPVGEKTLRKLLGIACIVLVIGRIVLWAL